MPVAHKAISDITAVPCNDRALLVQWKNLDISSLTGYVVAWRPLLKTDLSLTQFEIAERNKSSLIITGKFPSICIVGFKVHVLHILHTFYLVILIWFSSFPTRIQAITFIQDLLFPVQDLPVHTVRSLWALIHSNLLTFINRKLWALQALWDLCVS